MTMRSTAHDALRSVAYRGQWVLLELYGPADSESELDPIRVLKRKYHRWPYK